MVNIGCSDLRAMYSCYGNKFSGGSTRIDKLEVVVTPARKTGTNLHNVQESLS